MIIDLFCGAGGWTSQTGLSVVGFDIDPSACRTHSEAGHRTIRADVSEMTPPQKIDGLIASPPCQVFSKARRRNSTGERDIPEIVSRALNGRTDWQTTLEPGSGLVLEPLRWVMESNPEWTVWEQVEPCIEIWEAAGEFLKDIGYSVWVDVLNSEQYGVPQTRARAFLGASKSYNLVGPIPTHQKYIAKEPKRQHKTLFRIIEPWVSMEEALDLDDELVSLKMRDRKPTRYRTLPSSTIHFGHSRSGSEWTLSDGSKRGITEQEAAGLQTFPKDYKFYGSKTSIFKQIANAVPGALGKIVLESVGCNTQ